MVHSNIFSVSLRARMTLFFTGAFAVFVVVVCIGIVFWSQQNARHDAESLLQDALVVVQKEWTGKDTKESLDKALEEMREDPRMASIGITIESVDAQGNRLTRAATRQPALPTNSVARREWFTLTQVNGRLRSTAGLYFRPVREGLLRQAKLLTLLGSLAILGVAVSSWALVGRTLRPIAALSEQAHQATADPLQARLSASSNDTEVRQLVATLNEMLERLRENAALREQFYAAAAHELRTPLAVLSGEIEVTLSRQRTASEYHESLSELQRQTKRLTTLTEGLLMLNRLDRNTDGESAEKVDIADLCERTVVLFMPLAKEKQLQICTEWKAVNEVVAPPSHLAMLIRNLIENAVKYTAAEGQVAVTMRERMPNGMELCVTNTFPRPADVDRWTEAFYRTDVSRTTATGGNGLGLAICARIAHANGWQFTLEYSGETIAARVLFPEYSKVTV